MITVSFISKLLHFSILVVPHAITKHSKKYARLPFAKLIQPAIDLAEKGFIITAAEARGLNSTQGYFKKYNTVQPVFVKNGDWKAGDTLVQQDLAKKLRLIRDHGANAYLLSSLARALAELGEHERADGLIWCALELDPNEASSLNWLVAWLARRGQEVQPAYARAAAFAVDELKRGNL